MPIFVWNVLEEISSLPPFYCFPLFLCIVHLGRLSYLSLLFFGTLHSDGYIFPFLPCFLLLFFSQLFVRPPQDNHFAFLHFFFLGMVLITATCTVLQTSTRVLKALCLSDLIPWRGRDSANAAGVWGERSQWLDHTGVATIQCAHAPSRARLLGMLQEHSPRWAVLLRGAGLRLWHSWQIWAFQDPRKIWVVTGCLFTAWWLMPSLGPKLQWSLTFYLWLSCTCLSASGAINGNWLIPPSVFSRTRSFVLWAHQGSECWVRTFLREWSSVSLCFSGSPIVFLSVLCHISPLRVASGFSLRTDDAAHTSTLSPHWLRAYTSMWATSQLEIAILFDFCG